MDKSHFDDVIHLQFFQKCDNGQNKVDIETISLKCGEHYILKAQRDGAIHSIPSLNKWEGEDGNKYEPHGCLPKGKKVQ